MNPGQIHSDDVKSNRHRKLLLKASNEGSTPGLMYMRSLVVLSAIDSCPKMSSDNQAD